VSSVRFETGRAYKNSYFLFIDAAGYSTVVASNPLDRVSQAFDLLVERATNRVERIAGTHRCERAELWAWRGDGGFFVIHDDNESVARDVALETGKSLIRLDLRHLQDEFRQIGVLGELHVRAAIHRGLFHYLGGNHTRSFHSADVNLAAHLEEAAPRDSLAVSEDVYRVAGPHAADFEFAGVHEGRNVYLMSPPGGLASAKRAWVVRHGPAGWAPVHAFHERPSQQAKAQLINLAAHHLVDLGTALNTCSNYLLTTERPAPYRAAVLDLLRRGGSYHCIVLDPKSAAAEELSAQRQEDFPAKIARSLDRFAHFKEQYGEQAENFHVYQTGAYPGFHALAADPHTRDALILYSPYLAYTRPSPVQVERGDMPHYLVSAPAGQVFEKIRGLVQSYCAPETLHRVL
jgi:class 3 adenylate cyclase